MFNTCLELMRGETRYTQHMFVRQPLSNLSSPLPMDLGDLRIVYSYRRHRRVFILTIFFFQGEGVPHQKSHPSHLMLPALTSKPCHLSSFVLPSLIT